MPSLIGEIVVPFEVGRELAVGESKDRTWRDIQTIGGFVLRRQPVGLNPLLEAQIDAGEAAVIQTALDEGHGTVILDDLKARRIASMLGLSVTGTLGLLVQAKHVGCLSSVREAITILRQRGMWVTPALADKATALAGE